MSVTIEGIVESVSKKERTLRDGTVKHATSFKINGEWYSGGFKEWEVDKGDEVSCTYETNAKGYKDVKGIAVIHRGAPSIPANTGVPRPGRSFPIDPLAPERTINRQNALTNAVNYVVALKQTTSTVDQVIHIARQFEAYTTGDIDRELAENGDF